ncbi:hypothetical protein DFJ43DRAFT_985687, partial [Lentinula guzmanii]
STTKSAVTSLRKHRKLLKDGSVWPESVEQIFVDGKSNESKFSLFEYCRSRLRNAYLVQYLAQYGIERNRKQVASHLQVLKNMWKAEGNY